MSSLGYYVGQTRKARELAVSELGAEKAALMSDADIGDWIDENYVILWGDFVNDYDAHQWNEEAVALVPNDVYEGIEDSIVWLNR